MAALDQDGGAAIDMSKESQPGCPRGYGRSAMLPRMRATYSGRWIGLAFALMLPVPARACLEPDYHLPAALTFFGVAVLAIGLVTFVAWSVLGLLGSPGSDARVRALSLSCVVVSVVLAAVGGLLLPAFVADHAAIGHQLPAPTALLVSARHALLLPGALAVWLLRRSDSRQPQNLTLFCLAGALLLGYTGWALYLPMFR